MDLNFSFYLAGKIVRVHFKAIRLTLCKELKAFFVGTLRYIGYHNKRARFNARTNVVLCASRVVGGHLSDIVFHN